MGKEKRIIWKVLVMLAFVLFLMPAVGTTVRAAAAETKLNRSKLTLREESKYTLKLKNLPDGASVSFKSSDKSVALIGSKSGKITAKAKGVVRLTATVTEKNGEQEEYYCRLIVKHKTLPYEKGMLIKSKKKLKQLLFYSCENLFTGLEFRVPVSLTDDFMAYWKKFWLKQMDEYDGAFETTRYDLRVSRDNKFYYVEYYPQYGLEMQTALYLQDKSLKSDVSKTARSYAKQIEAIVDEIITKKMSDRRKVTAIHDYMTEHYSYSRDNEKKTADEYKDSEYCFHAMLDDGTGVCQAYSTLFRMLCISAGVPCELVPGVGTDRPGESREQGNPHMWNRVFIGGQWLYLDVTYDDTEGSKRFFLKTKKDFYAMGYHYED